MIALGLNLVQACMAFVCSPDQIPTKRLNIFGITGLWIFIAASLAHLWWYVYYAAVGML